jgi:hypothetical protein
LFAALVFSSAAAAQTAEAPATALTPAPTAAPAPPVSAVHAELGLPLQRHISADEYDGYSSVTAVAHTAEGFTLFGTYHAAILYDGATYEKIPVPAAYVTALCRDRDGVMWGGGDNEIGVLATDPADGRLRYVSRTDLLPSAVRSFGRMRALVASSAGIFALTSSGVLRFTARQAELLPVPPESRLQLFAVAGRVYLQDPRRGLLVFEDNGFRAVDTGHPLTGRRIQFVERDAAHALCLVEGEGPFQLVFATGRLEKITTPLTAMLAEPMGRGLAIARRTLGSHPRQQPRHRHRRSRVATRPSARRQDRSGQHRDHRRRARRRSGPLAGHGQRPPAPRSRAGPHGVR